MEVENFDREENEYNTFEAVDNATEVIVDYLMAHNENLWKLLYYTSPHILPLSQPNLTFEQKKNMICTDPYEIDSNVTKNVLFQIVTDEAFSTAIPQLRIEIGDIVPTDRVRGYMTINFQIVVPNKQDLFIAPYNRVARRTDAIFRELMKTLNGKYITGSKFYSKMFVDRTSIAGKKTGSTRQQFNKEFTGRWITMAVLL